MTQQGNSPDWFLRIISVLSLILAISSLSFSFLQYRESIAELVSIEASIGYGQIQLTDTDFGLDGSVVQVPWQLILSNTGSRRISITNYRVLELVENPQTGEIAPRYYSDIQGALLDSNNNPIDLPWMLDSGESKKFRVYVGLLADVEAYKILADEQESTLSVRNARLALGRKGIDIYGNRVDFHEFPNGTYRWSSSSEAHSPVFLFEFETGRDNKLSAIASEYPF